MLLRIRENAVGQRLGVRGSQWGHIQRTQSSVHAYARRAIGRDVQIAAAHLDHLFQQFAKRNPGHCSPFLYRTVSRSTSSMVVWPKATLIKPLRRNVIMPNSMAFFFNSSAHAPTR